MKTILTHTSALEFWRSELSDVGSARSVCRSTTVPEKAPHGSDIRTHALVRCGTLSLPVHVLARENRKASSALIVHRAQSLPERSLRAVFFPGFDEPVFVTCPELTFVHMASAIGFPLAVHLGYEFCGTFAPDKQHPYGIRNRPPLTNPRKLASYLDNAGYLHGAKAARRALPHVLGGSASPRESTLAELLTLPYLYGGSKLEHPAMNATIAIPQHSNWTTNRSSFRCDLLWRDRGVAVEYDSTLCHTGAKRIAEDASRRNALEALGLTVVTATWRQVANYQEYNRFARILAGHLGTRIRPACSDYSRKQLELRRQLLSQKGLFA